MSEVFTARHETDLSEWDSQTGDDCTRDASAALGSSAGGLLTTVVASTASYMVKTITTNTSGKLRCRFYIDPNTLTMTSGDKFWVFTAKRADGTPLFYVSLEKVSATWNLYTYCYYDTGGSSATQTVITDAPHWVEVYEVRATTNLASDGTYTWWIDTLAAPINAITGIDNYDRIADFAIFNMGAAAGVDAGTSGPFFLDELVINDDGGAIGPLLGETLSINIAGDNSDYYHYGVKVR